MTAIQPGSLTTPISWRIFRTGDLGAGAKTDEPSPWVQRTSPQRNAALTLCGVSMYRAR
jgi:hypothetical protein